MLFFVMFFVDIEGIDEQIAKKEHLKRKVEDEIEEDIQNNDGKSQGLKLGRLWLRVVPYKIIMFFMFFIMFFMRSEFVHVLSLPPP